MSDERRLPPLAFRALLTSLEAAAAPLVDPVWFSLARFRFVAKTPGFECWISLDFLGFSRPNRDFSMGYADKASENFSWASVPWTGRGAGTGAQDFGS